MFSTLLRYWLAEPDSKRDSVEEQMGQPKKKTMFQGTVEWLRRCHKRAVEWLPGPWGRPEPPPPYDEREMGAYEALWMEPKATFRSLSKRFANNPGCVPSDLLSEDQADQAEKCAEFAKRRFKEAGIEDFGFRMHSDDEYPEKLRDATHPVACLYYQGRWNLVESRSVAVIGSRRPSDDGLARTQRLVRELVKDNFTIASGLAAGIDRMAHETAIHSGGRTFAVIGTPLSDTYPKQNADLQRYIAENFLVISQIPVKRYESQTFRLNRFFFPERNKTMSALTEATVIVEAGEKSGTLIQASEALRQGRKLFVLDSCFRDPHLSWPDRLATKGAIRVRSYDDIRQHLTTTLHQDR